MGSAKSSAGRSEISLGVLGKRFSSWVEKTMNYTFANGAQLRSEFYDCVHKQLDIPFFLCIMV
ncbi:hypothetical protein M378DRAFT_155617 [Amanita muscaria Koide BX008]|uniref:Uncharacterized protein n=1 Tax=Amanita muscaria (strain Koide BX008) TaxID=946122 RepID=A0A0C2TTN9_AMAMK|nr:hypothetical protein M378DRAFT_155617 [Amanita muscaria Koide BX008]